MCIDYYVSLTTARMVLTIPPNYAFGYFLSFNGSMPQSFKQHLYAVTVTNSISDLESAAYPGDQNVFS